MRNGDDDIETMKRLTMSAFGISDLTSINNSSTLFGIGDGIQSIFYEFTGSYDKQVLNTASAIREGISEKGEVFVVAHSQGTQIFCLALNLLTDDEKRKIHYYGAGSEAFVDGKANGLASSRNVKNAGDMVPIIGNMNPIKTLSSKQGEEDWVNIKVEGKGNKHEFQVFYAGDMTSWAREESKNYETKQNEQPEIGEVNNESIQSIKNIASGNLISGLGSVWTSERGSEQRSGIQAYGWEGIQDEDGIRSERRQETVLFRYNGTGWIRQSYCSRSNILSNIYTREYFNISRFSLSWKY
jgi:hypothetical protein